MKKLISLLLAAGLAIVPSPAQTLYKNVQKGTDGNNRLTESLAVPTGKSLTAEAGSTVTLSGSVGGTPTGGTLNLSSLTITLPATVSGGTSSFQPLDAALTALAAGSDFVQFTGPLTTTKIFTLPNASATLLYAGGDAGTPSALVGTNLTGTAAGLTAGNVTTNANLTGHVTSTGNAAVLGSFTLAQLNTAISDADVATGGGTVTGTSSGTNTGDQTITLTGDATGSGTGSFAVNVGRLNGTALSGLATGILKNTTTTGVPSIAVAGDFPTLNQSTTGSAATLTTPRAIYGNNFDGSAALAQVIASTYGGTGNGFTKFSGPATAEKTFTLPDSSATLLYAGGAISGTTVAASGAITGSAAANSLGLGGSTNQNDILTIAGSSANLYGPQIHLKRNGVLKSRLGLQSGIAGDNSDNTLLYCDTGNIKLYPAATLVAEFSSTGLAVTGTVSATYAGSGGGVSAKNSDNTSNSHFFDCQKSDGTVIGYGGRVTTTDSVVWSTTSDRDRKENIRTFTDSAAIIDGLRPVLFNWKLSPDEEFVTGKEADTVEPDTVDAEGKTIPGKVIKGKPIKTRRADLPADRQTALVADSTDIVGFIAQEEQLVDPLLIRSGAVTLDAQGVARWRSDAALVPILVAELKALRARVAALEARP